ncbi:hypothetical protein AUC47_04350 [Microbacterium sp. SZ1]|uniref:hypothetical protein n=1 Tax=Microbacterium sp. SZ1 TaxID=1849736 RepID=UPI000BBC7D0A|nr:hypothetical protein [Microbacterium sp. SZ1]PCE13890.1 hypothetical protein AUC47_04350 [Microbacterium sp. SZ1]
MTALLDDFLSGDPSRVLHATWETIASRDIAVLRPLVPAVPRIRRATEALDLGGIIYANRGHLDHALDKLAQFDAGECWCAGYVGILTFDPKKEEAVDHVRIVSTSEPGWSMTYQCECVVCGLTFDVEQGDHHFMWWKWVPRGAIRPLPKR